MSNPSNDEDEAFGVISEDKKKIKVKGTYGIIFNLVDSIEWMDESEAKALREEAENDADPADAPTNHYTLRPGHAGKLVWISGAPGFGKTTTARRMMEMKGYIYYEGDLFLGHRNPYPSLEGKK